MRKLRDIAAIDIGSNSVRLVLYRLEGRAIWTVFNEKVLAGLGRDLPVTGRLSADGLPMAMTALRRFAAVHGTSNAGEGDVIDGFEIGTWVASRRADYRKGRLSAERIRRIETEFPDWRWTVRPAATKSRR